MYLLTGKKVPLSPDNNPIGQFYEVIGQSSTGGTGYTWKIFDGRAKASKTEASVFFFDKRKSLKLPSKLARTNRTSLSDLLRWDIGQLQRLNHPSLLKVLHPLQENASSLAFASEPVAASLGRLLNRGAGSNAFSEDLRFEELEIKCGLLQLSDALAFLHCSAQVLHGNICPENIYVTKYGSWKLGGFMFSQKSTDGSEKFPSHPWSSKLPHHVQPNLDYLAPEAVCSKEIGLASDIFSFGCVICAIYNGGRSILNATSVEEHIKQMLDLKSKFEEISKEMAPSLRDTVARMIARNVKERPSIQLFSLAKYFHDSAATTLMQLDSIDNADTAHKVQFYCTQLRDTLYLIPQKLWFDRILPKIEKELNSSHDISSALIRPLLYMLEHSEDRGPLIIAPIIKRLIFDRKDDQSMLHICLIENSDVISSRINENQLRDLLIKLVAEGFDAQSQQLQVTAVCSLPKLKSMLNGEILQRVFLPRLVKFFKTISSSKLQLNVLLTLDCLLDMLTEDGVLEVVAFLTEIHTNDMEVAITVAEIYRHLMSDCKRELKYTLVASKILPSLLPYIGNPTVDINEFEILLEIGRDLFDYVENQQRQRILDEYGDLKSKNFNRCPSIRCRQASIPRAMGSMGESPSVMRRSSNYLSVDSGEPTPVRQHSVGSISPSRKCSIFSTNSVPSFSSVSMTRSPKIFTSSQPNTPLNSRRHSMADDNAAVGPVRKSSFTNLGHNLAQMFAWGSADTASTN